MTFHCPVKAIVILALFSLIRVDAQPESLLVEARRLAATGAWNEAVTEYERYLFFCDDTAPVVVYRAVAELYAHQGLFDRAAGVMDRASRLPVCDTLSDAIRIERAAFTIAAGNTQTALLELLRVAAFTTAPVLRNQARRYICLIHALSMQWGSLSSTAREPGVLDPQLHGRLDSLLGDTGLVHRPSPAVARWLSTFVPGLGQFYAHDYRNALNAFTVSCATGGLTAFSFINGYYREALLTDIVLFWRYYSGNRWKAAEAAQRFNERNDRHLREKILALFAGQ